LYKRPEELYIKTFLPNPPSTLEKMINTIDRQLTEAVKTQIGVDGYMTQPIHYVQVLDYEDQRNQDRFEYSDTKEQSHSKITRQHKGKYTKKKKK
jgi:hypothetical protein